MFPGQCGNTAFFFKSQPDQFHFEFRGIVFPGKSFFSAHEVSTCKISGCLSYRILDPGPDGTQTTLTLESTSPIPEPHSFNVRLSLGHRGHVHDYDVAFAEHDHDHDHSELDGLDVNSKEYQDAHELAHANDIKRRFDGKEVTNGQILIFGLTGGLIPCPAAITVLLICLQLKALTLGATLVVCFSIGLALTLVTVGVGAAISVRQVAKRWSGFNTIARRAPYISSALIAAVGIYMGIHGWNGLVH